MEGKFKHNKNDNFGSRFRRSGTSSCGQEEALRES